MKLDENSITGVLQDILEHSEKTQKTIENLEHKLEQRDRTIEKLALDNQLLIDSFERKYASIQIKAPQPDLSGVRYAIDQGMIGVHEAIEKKPSPRQVRLLLFPETNQGQYYKMVFGRLIPWSFALVAAVYFYSLTDKAIEAYTATQKNTEGNICIDAWKTAFDAASQIQKNKMGQAYKDAKARH